MTQQNNVVTCEANLLAAIKALGPDAKLLPLKTKLNEKRTEACPFATLACVDQACASAMSAGNVGKMGTIYYLTEVGIARLEELSEELDPVAA